MTSERNYRPDPFSSFESAGDAYITHGFLEEADEILTEAIEVTTNPNLKSRLEVKRLALPFHYIHAALNTPDTGNTESLSLPNEVEANIEATYGLLGELLEREIGSYEETRQQFRETPRDSPDRNTLGMTLRGAKGRVSEITFQALAAREYSYNPEATLYAVPTTENIDRYGLSRASDLLFFLSSASNELPTETVFAQVKTTSHVMALKNRERAQRGQAAFQYDDDIAMLILNEATQQTTDFSTGELLLPRAIVRELNGTNTPEDDALIAEALAYTKQQVTDIAKKGLATAIAKNKNTETQKMPEQVGA